MKDSGVWPGEVEKSCVVKGGGVSVIPNRVTARFLSERISDRRGTVPTEEDGLDAVRRGEAVIIDVRSETEFGLCSLPSSISESSPLTPPADKQY